MHVLRQELIDGVCTGFEQLRAVQIDDTQRLPIPINVFQLVIQVNDTLLVRRFEKLRELHRQINPLFGGQAAASVRAVGFHQVEQTLMARHPGLVVVILVMVVVSVYFVNAHPVERIWGDEPDYVEISHQEYSFVAKLARLIPGNMYFEWWPPFPYSVYGLFATDEALVGEYRNLSAISAHFSKKKILGAVFDSMECSEQFDK